MGAKESQIQRRLLDKNHQLVLLSGEKRQFQRRGSWITCPASWLRAGPYQIKRRWGFGPAFGPIIYLDLRFADRSTLKNAFFKPLWHGGKFFWWRDLFMPARVTGLLWEDFGSAPHQAPLELSEREVVGRPQSDSLQRIDYLIASVLELVEKREDGPNALYKDPKDGRLWQLSYAPQDPTVERKLTQVNQMQWSYFYIETKEGERREGEQEAQEFFDSLEVDSPLRACSETHCQEPRVRFSSLCREHHLAAVFPQWHERLFGGAGAGPDSI